MLPVLEKMDFVSDFTEKLIRVQALLTLSNLCTRCEIHFGTMRVQNIGFTGENVIETHGIFFVISF